MWDMLASELRARETNVSVSWVKGHAKKIDIDRGRTTWEDKAGNDGADELARAGARSHEICSEVVGSASLRKLAARQVHEMIICVLKARMAEEARINGARAYQDDTDDRGSNFDMNSSDTEPLQSSDTVSTSACLDDECDEGPGTHLGVVQ